MRYTYIAECYSVIKKKERMPFAATGMSLEIIILSKPGFSSMGTLNFQMFKLVLEKAEESEIKLPTSAGSLENQESSRKISISALLTMSKPLCGSQ